MLFWIIYHFFFIKELHWDTTFMFIFSVARLRIIVLTNAFFVKTIILTVLVTCIFNVVNHLIPSRHHLLHYCSRFCIRFGHIFLLTIKRFKLRFSMLVKILSTTNVFYWVLHFSAMIWKSHFLILFVVICIKCELIVIIVLIVCVCVCVQVHACMRVWTVV
jgi:hypothetical protein